MSDARESMELEALKLRQEYEIRRMQLEVEFAKYGFYGTLLSALTGMVVILSLAIVVAWTKMQYGFWIVVVFSIVLAVGVISFGYFSLFKLPKIGLEWKEFKGSVGDATQQ